MSIITGINVLATVWGILYTTTNVLRTYAEIQEKKSGTYNVTPVMIVAIIMVAINVIWG